MLAAPLLRLRLTAKSAVHQAVWGSVGGLFALVGMAFVFAALFILVSQAFGPVAACLIFGGIFLGFGFLAFAWAQRPPRIVPRHVAREMSSLGGSSHGAASHGGIATGLTTAGIVNALVLGISAGRAARRRRRR